MQVVLYNGQKTVVCIIAFLYRLLLTAGHSSVHSKLVIGVYSLLPTYTHFVYLLVTGK